MLELVVRSCHQAQCQIWLLIIGLIYRDVRQMAVLYYSTQTSISLVPQ